MHFTPDSGSNGPWVPMDKTLVECLMIDMSAALMANQKPLSMKASPLLGTPQEAAKGTLSPLTNGL